MPPEWLPAEALAFWRRAQLGKIPTANRALIVFHTKSLETAGFFRYKLTHGGTRLSMLGTWVGSKYRRRGLATRMWKQAFSTPGVKTVTGVVISHISHKLLLAVRQQMPGISLILWSWKRKMYRYAGKRHWKWQMVKEKV